MLQENVSSVNSLDSKEKVINSQNIPVASPVPAQLTDTIKTESKNLSKRDVSYCTKDSLVILATLIMVTDDKPVDNSKLGKKKYTIAFMMSLRCLPQCQMAVKVNYLPVTIPPPVRKKNFIFFFNICTYINFRYSS